MKITKPGQDRKSSSRMSNRCTLWVPTDSKREVQGYKEDDAYVGNKPSSNCDQAARYRYGIRPRADKQGLGTPWPTQIRGKSTWVEGPSFPCLAIVSHILAQFTTRLLTLRSSPGVIRKNALGSPTTSATEIEEELCAFLDGTP